MTPAGLPASRSLSLTPRKTASLYFDNSPGVCELLLDGLGLILGDALFHGLGRSIHQFLGFFQAQAGDFADGLDYIDLVRADLFEDDGKLGFLFRRSRRCSRAAAGYRDQIG